MAVFVNSLRLLHTHADTTFVAQISVPVQRFVLTRASQTFCYHRNKIIEIVLALLVIIDFEQRKTTNCWSYYFYFIALS